MFPHFFSCSSIAVSANSFHFLDRRVIPKYPLTWKPRYCLIHGLHEIIDIGVLSCLVFFTIRLEGVCYVWVGVHDWRTWLRLWNQKEVLRGLWLVMRRAFLRRRRRGQLHSSSVFQMSRTKASDPLWMASSLVLRKTSFRIETAWKTKQQA